MIFDKDGEEIEVQKSIIDNYINSDPVFQKIKNGQMLAMVHALIIANNHLACQVRDLEKRVKKLELESDFNE